MLLRPVLLALAALTIGLSATVARADNPIIQTRFTADPAPLVHDGVVYLYTSHDEDDAEGFKMLDWRLYSSTDMVNWTDRGSWPRSRPSPGRSRPTTPGRRR